MAQIDGLQPPGDPEDRAGLMVAFALGELEDMIGGRRPITLLALSAIKATLQVASGILKDRTRE